MSGTPYAANSGVPDSACGYYSGLRWHGHAWVVVTGNTIVDITADQFGCAPVVITTVDDARYVASVDLADPNAIKARHEAVAVLWVQWLGANCDKL